MVTRQEVIKRSVKAGKEPPSSKVRAAVRRDFGGIDIFTSSGQRRYVDKQVKEAVNRLIRPHYRIVAWGTRNPAGERQKPTDHTLFKDNNVIVQGPIGKVKARLAKITKTIKTKAKKEAEYRVKEAMMDYERGFYDQMYGKSGDPVKATRAQLSERAARSIAGVQTAVTALIHRIDDKIRNKQLTNPTLQNAKIARSQLIGLSNDIRDAKRGLDNMSNPRWRGGHSVTTSVKVVLSDALRRLTKIRQKLLDVSKIDNDFAQAKSVISKVDLAISVLKSIGKSPNMYAAYSDAPGRGPAPESDLVARSKERQRIVRLAKQLHKVIRQAKDSAFDSLEKMENLVFNRVVSDEAGIDWHRAMDDMNDVARSLEGASMKIFISDRTSAKEIASNMRAAIGRLFRASSFLNRMSYIPSKYRAMVNVPKQRLQTAIRMAKAVDKMIGDYARRAKSAGVPVKASVLHRVRASIHPFNYHRSRAKHLYERTAIDAGNPAQRSSKEIVSLLDKSGKRLADMATQIRKYPQASNANAIKIEFNNAEGHFNMAQTLARMQFRKYGDQQSVEDGFEALRTARPKLRVIRRLINELASEERQGKSAGNTKPWAITHRGEDYVVQRKDKDGKPFGPSLGKHPSREAAQRQIGALYASEGKMANQKATWDQMMPILGRNIDRLDRASHSVFRSFTNYVDQRLDDPRDKMREWHWAAEPRRVVSSAEENFQNALRHKREPKYAAVWLRNMISDLTKARQLYNKLLAQHRDFRPAKPLLGQIDLSMRLAQKVRAKMGPSNVVEIVGRRSADPIKASNLSGQHRVYSIDRRGKNRWELQIHSGETVLMWFAIPRELKKALAFYDRAVGQGYKPIWSHRGRNVITDLIEGGKHARSIPEAKAANKTKTLIVAQHGNKLRIDKNMKINSVGVYDAATVLRKIQQLDRMGFKDAVSRKEMRQLEKEAEGKSGNLTMASKATPNQLLYKLANAVDKAEDSARISWKQLDRIMSRDPDAKEKYRPARAILVHAWQDLQAVSFRIRNDMARAKPDVAMYNDLMRTVESVLGRATLRLVVAQQKLPIRSLTEVPKKKVQVAHRMAIAVRKMLQQKARGKSTRQTGESTKATPEQLVSKLKYYIRDSADTIQDTFRALDRYLSTITDPEEQRKIKEAYNALSMAWTITHRQAKNLAKVRNNPEKYEDVAFPIVNGLGSAGIKIARAKRRLKNPSMLSQAVSKNKLAYNAAIAITRMIRQKARHKSARRTKGQEDREMGETKAPAARVIQQAIGSLTDAATDMRRYSGRLATAARQAAQDLPDRSAGTGLAKAADHLGMTIDAIYSVAKQMDRDRRSGRVMGMMQSMNKMKQHVASAKGLARQVSDAVRKYKIQDRTVDQASRTIARVLTGMPSDMNKVRSGLSQLREEIEGGKRSMRSRKTRKPGDMVISLAEMETIYPEGATKMKRGGLKSIRYPVARSARRSASVKGKYDQLSPAALRKLYDQLSEEKKYLSQLRRTLVMAETASHRLKDEYGKTVYRRLKIIINWYEREYNKLKKELAGAEQALRKRQKEGTLSASVKLRLWPMNKPLQTDADIADAKDSIRAINSQIKEKNVLIARINDSIKADKRIAYVLGEIGKLLNKAYMQLQRAENVQVGNEYNAIREALGSTARYTESASKEIRALNGKRASKIGELSTEKSKLEKAKTQYEKKINEAVDKIAERERERRKKKPGWGFGR